MKCLRGGVQQGGVNTERELTVWWEELSSLHPVMNPEKYSVIKKDIYLWS
jgi:hypothetical protein